MKAFNLPQTCRSALSCIRAAEGAPSFVRAFRKNEHSAPASRFCIPDTVRTREDSGQGQAGPGEAQCTGGMLPALPDIENAVDKTC